MKVQNFLVIGYGSSGRRYSKILNKLKIKKKNLHIFKAEA